MFDLRVRPWREKQATGEVIVVRVADDIVQSFESEREARRFQDTLVERTRQFNLQLHPEKTRLREFGPFAARNRRQRGEGKSATFGFLGCTHVCARKRSNGRFTVLRQTIRKRPPAKLAGVKLALRHRLHVPIPEQPRSQ